MVFYMKWNFEVVAVLLDELFTKLLDCWIFLTFFTILKIWLFNVFSTFYYSNCALKKNMWNVMLIFKKALSCFYKFDLILITFSKIQPKSECLLSITCDADLTTLYLFCKIINEKMPSYSGYQAKWMLRKFTCNKIVFLLYR